MNTISVANTIDELFADYTATLEAYAERAFPEDSDMRTAFPAEYTRALLACLTLLGVPKTSVATLMCGGKVFEGEPANFVLSTAAATGLMLQMDRAFANEDERKVLDAFTNIAHLTATLVNREASSEDEAN